MKNKRKKHVSRLAQAFSQTDASVDSQPNQHVCISRSRVPGMSQYGEIQDVATNSDAVNVVGSSFDTIHPNLRAALTQS